jgi:hypothetical protein
MEVRMRIWLIRSSPQRMKHLGLGCNCMIWHKFQKDLNHSIIMKDCQLRMGVKEPSLDAFGESASESETYVSNTAFQYDIAVCSTTLSIALLLPGLDIGASFLHH